MVSVKKRDRSSLFRRGSYMAIVSAICVVAVLVCRTYVYYEDMLGTTWLDLSSPGQKLYTDNNLLLSVPFYVYEDLAWTSATFGKQTTVEELSRQPRRSKHKDDFFFMKSSLVHPMRTLDPSKAKLFVIPLLMNTFADRHFFSGKEYRLCYKGDCDRILLGKAAEILGGSTWLQQYPEKHIVVQSHYLSELYMNVPKVLREILREVNAISFEDHKPNREDRLRFPKLYVGSPCTPSESKSHDVAMIASVNVEKPHYFQDRLNICEWIQNSTVNLPYQHHNIRMSHCGSGQQCPALAQSKYGFHTRGDTLGSNRLSDTILSETVPIFTLPEQYDILLSWLDWRKLSVLLSLNDGKNKTQFLLALEDLLADTQGYMERFEAIRRHKDLLDWNTLHPFDLYMYNLQAELYPETRHLVDILSHVWPALNLPPPVPSY